MLVAAPPPCTPRDLAAARSREGVRASTLLPSVHREKDTRSHFEGSTLVLSEAADSRKDPEALAAEEVDEWRAMLRESRAAFAGVPMYRRVRWALGDVPRTRRGAPPLVHELAVADAVAGRLAERGRPRPTRWAGARERVSVVVPKI